MTNLFQGHNQVFEYQILPYDRLVESLSPEESIKAGIRIDRSAAVKQDLNTERGIFEHRNQLFTFH